MRQESSAPISYLSLYLALSLRLNHGAVCIKEALAAVSLAVGKSGCVCVTEEADRPHLRGPATSMRIRARVSTFNMLHVLTAIRTDTWRK